MNILKSIGAVVAGFVTVVVLSTLTDSLMQSLGIFPPLQAGMYYVPWMLALALLYRTLYTILGGYVTAWLAPRKPMLHVWVLAGFGQLGGLLGVYVGIYYHLPGLWYPIALAVLAIPSVWFGGWIRTKNRASTVAL